MAGLNGKPSSRETSTHGNESRVNVDRTEIRWFGILAALRYGMTWLAQFDCQRRATGARLCTALRSVMSVYAWGFGLSLRVPHRSVPDVESIVE